MTGKPDRKKNKEGKRRSSAALFCNIFGTVMLVALVLVCLPLTVPRLFGYHSYTVISGSMEPAIPTGSLVYIQEMEPEDVEAEVRRLASEGYREAVLTGIHLSSYGMDFQDGTDLLSLIRRIHGIDGIERIRFGSLEPRIITEEFASALAGMEKICPHFHLSLQSGCDETLKRMNRHYTCEEYLERCQILRDCFSNPAITTDVIVGFPGETEEEFEQTQEFLKTVHFYEMHVFKYSRRAGTRADRMPDQIPEPVKTKRSAALLKLEAEMSKEYRASFLGKQAELLLEEPAVIGGQTYMIGHTNEYVKGAVPIKEGEAAGLKNTFYTGTLKNFLTDEIIFLAESKKLG